MIEMMTEANSAAIVPNEPNTGLAIRGVHPVDGWVTAWLDAKAGKSGSAETLTAYRDSMTDFRAVLHLVGLDLGRGAEFCESSSTLPATSRNMMAYAGTIVLFLKRVD